MKLEISDLDDARLQSAFKEMDELGRNFLPVWQSFAEVLQESHMYRWGLEVGPDMGPWEALSPRTWRTKRTSRMLYEEGDLLRGLVTQPRPTEMEFGLLDWKAPIQHFGTDDIPARPLVGLSDDDRAALLEILQDEIEARWG